MPRIDTSAGPDQGGNRHMKKPGTKVLIIIAIALTGLVLAIAAGLGVLAAMDTINWIKPVVVGSDKRRPGAQGNHRRGPGDHWVSAAGLRCRQSLC